MPRNPLPLHPHCAVSASHYALFHTKHWRGRRIWPRMGAPSSLTTWHTNHCCSPTGSGSVGSSPRAMFALFMRHNSFFALQAFMIAMYRSCGHQARRCSMAACSGEHVSCPPCEGKKRPADRRSSGEPKHISEGGAYSAYREDPHNICSLAAGTQTSGTRHWECEAQHPRHPP